MKLKKIEQVKDFLAAIDQCKGNVTLSSVYGDVFNLKSAFNQYIAMGALLGEKGDELELFCENREDEALMERFFLEHPETL